MYHQSFSTSENKSHYDCYSSRSQIFEWNFMMTITNTIRVNNYNNILSLLPWNRQTSKGESWDPINWFNPVTYVFLSQT